MKFYRNEIKIGGKNRILVTCNHHENNRSKWIKQIGNFHHIHVIDRSGSMGGSIDELIEDVIATFSIMGKDDIVTVMWFSSINQHGIIVKGAKNDPSLKEILRKYKSVVGTTCFSKPMEMVESIVHELQPMCSNVVVNFFTDGMPVVPWSDGEEYSKTLSIADRFTVMAMNTIGYGQYYSQEFLKQLAAKSQYGKFVHASDIREYQKIFDTNYQIVKDNILENILIECKGKVIYLNRKTTKMSENGIRMTSLDNNKNQFFMLLENDQEIIINKNDVYGTEEFTEEANSETLMNFYYALAYNEYKNGNRSGALDIIVKIIGNQYLADRQLSAWTFDEVSAYEKVLEDRLFNPTNRKIDPTCTPSYLPKDNAFCVYDMLKLLAEDGASYLPYHPHAEKYERIGKETNYSEFDFKMVNSNAVVGKFDDLVFNKDRCNIGIKFMIFGYVNLKEEDQTKNMRTIECVSFRTHNLILDGYPNVKTIVVESSYDLFEKLQKNKVNVEKISTGKEKFTTYKIDLTSIPVINRKLAKGITGSDISSSITKALDLEAEAKVLGYLIEKAGDTKAKFQKEYSDSQKSLLEKYGIDSSGTYRGIGASQKSNEECDYYVSKNVTFSMKGYVSIPSVNEYLKRLSEKKKLDGAVGLIHKYYEQFKNSNIDILKKEYKEVQKHLCEIRCDLAVAKMAVILTGSWIEDFKKNDKGEFVFEKYNNTYIMKISEQKQYY